MTTASEWEQTCPLCGNSNHCAMASDQPVARCWCYDATISAEALAAIPEESVGKRCLCQACGAIGGDQPIEG